MSTKRPTPPPLVHRAPDCGLCGKETSHDGDSLVCESCRCYWPDDTGPGAWYDPDEEFCGEVVEPHKDGGYDNIRDYRYVCALPAYHSEWHQGVMERDGFTSTWSWRVQS